MDKPEIKNNDLNQVNSPSRIKILQRAFDANTRTLEQMPLDDQTRTEIQNFREHYKLFMFPQKVIRAQDSAKPDATERHMVEETDIKGLLEVDTLFVTHLAQLRNTEERRQWREIPLVDQMAYFSGYQLEQPVQQPTEELNTLSDVSAAPPITVKDDNFESDRIHMPDSFSINVSEINGEREVVKRLEVGGVEVEKLRAILSRMGTTLSAFPDLVNNFDFEEHELVKVANFMIKMDGTHSKEQSHDLLSRLDQIDSRLSLILRGFGPVFSPTRSGDEVQDGKKPN